MTRSEILGRINAFVHENFLYTRPDFVLGEDQSLLDSGVIDSMGVMELIEFMESEFGVTVQDADVTEEKIGTLGAIADYVLANRAH